MKLLDLPCPGSRQLLMEKASQSRNALNAAGEGIPFTMLEPDRLRLAQSCRISCLILSANLRRAQLTCICWDSEFQSAHQYLKV